MQKPHSKLQQTPEQLNHGLLKILANVETSCCTKGSVPRKGSPPLVIPKTVEEWNAQCDAAIKYCVECMRTGTPIDWSRYNLSTRKAGIVQRAKAVFKEEQETALLLGTAFKLGKSSMYQYLMLLCLLLGVLAGKPSVAFRETDPKRISQTK